MIVAAVICAALFCRSFADGCMEHLRGETQFRHTLRHSLDELRIDSDSSFDLIGVRLSHSGVMLASQLQQQELRVYYNISLVEPASIKLHVRLEDPLLSPIIGSFECNPRQINSHFLSYPDCPPNRGRLGHGIFYYTMIVDFEISAAASFRAAKSINQSIKESLVLINRPKVPWPLENTPGVWPPTEPNTVANIMEDYQTFNGMGAPYWHQGLDIRSELESPAVDVPMIFQSETADVNRMAGKVHSTCAGRVVNRVRYGSGDLYWSVMVLDNYGFVWQYHHMDPKSITVNIGDIVAEGQILGRIAFWPSKQNGHNYHHVHMNVARPQASWYGADGQLVAPKPYIDGWTYYNPYDFLDHGKHYWNDKAPYSSDGLVYLFKHGESEAFATHNMSMNPSSQSSIITVDGTIDIVVSFQSEFRPPNKVPGYPYILGVNELWWEVEGTNNLQSNDVLFSGDKVKAAIWNSSFARMPPSYLISMARMGPDWPCAPAFTVACSDRFLLPIHRRQFSINGSRKQSIFDYRNRRLYYSITNTGPMGYPLDEHHHSTGWQTKQSLFGEQRFPNGQYKVTIGARDWWRNEAEISFTIEIRNN